MYKYICFYAKTCNKYSLNDLWEKYSARLRNRRLKLQVKKKKCEGSSEKEHFAFLLRSLVQYIFSFPLIHERWQNIIGNLGVPKLEVVVPVLVEWTPYFFVVLEIDFGKSLRKRKSQIKHGDVYCLEIQSHRFTADKLSCFF